MRKEDIYDVRNFNRFYTNILKLTDKYHLHTHLTILEARILLEIDYGLNTANQLLNLLKLDKGYISRVLKKLEKEQLIQKDSDPKDLRIKILTLTPKGHQALDKINHRADDQVAKIFDELNEEQVNDIIKAMKKIQSELKEE